MTDIFNKNQIQSIIGYSFKEPTLLRTAFTHSSRYVYNEETNERLLFLGRRLFDLVVCDYIYSRFPFTREDQLEKQLASYQSGLLCENYLKDRKLDKFILLSEMSEMLRSSPVVHGEIFLAILGAIFRDGGMPSLKGFLLPLLRTSDGEVSYVPKPESVKRNVTVGTPTQRSEKTEVRRRQQEVSRSRVPVSKTIREPSQTELISDDMPAEKPASFIRDALTPVRLPESMKQQQKKPRERKKQPPIIPEFDTTEGENYKSMLQELVQKNIRSSSVLLKYETGFISGGLARTDVTLDGKILASAEADNKRLSERMAAKKAYHELTDKASETYRVFRSLSNSDIDLPERREDYISKLNQHFQRTDHESATPISYERRYSTEKKVFCVALLHNDEELSSGKGPTLKEARQDAAKKALESMGLL